MEATTGIALAGIVLSLFATYLAYRSGKETRETSLADSRRAREAAAKEAKASRVFDRRKDVYEDVLEYTYRTEDMVMRIAPFITFTGDPGPPEWPGENEMRRMSARTAAWGSPELLAKLLKLKAAVQEFRGAAYVLEASKPGGQDKPEMWKDVGAKRDVVHALVQEIVNLANHELTN